VACRAALDRDIAALDALIGEQLDAILHHPRLRRIEGSWRGLAWLTADLDPAGRAKVRFLTFPGPNSAAIWNEPPNSTRASYSGRCMKRNSAPPAASPDGLLIVDHEVRAPARSRAPPPMT